MLRSIALTLVANGVEIVYEIVAGPALLQMLTVGIVNRRRTEVSVGVQVAK